MLMDDIAPYVRYVRYFIPDGMSGLADSKTMPLDCRLFYVCEGKGSVEVDNETMYLVKGDLLLINSGIEYRFHKEFIKFLAINFDYTQKFSSINMPIPPGKKGDRILENVNFTDTSELNTFIVCRNMFSVESRLSDMLLEYENQQQYSEAVLTALLKTVIMLVIRKYRNKNNSSKLDIQNILSYLQTNYNRNITNRELANYFHFNQNYINDFFKKYMGVSIHKYILEYRIKTAISLLEENKLSIEDIARKTGFYDCSYFSRYFKKITGNTPSSYR